MLAMPGLRAFCLAPDRASGGISCTTDGVFVGDVPLLEKSGTWIVRPLEALNRELSATYRLPIDVTSKSRALTLIANAFNRGDLAMAAIATVQMQFPDPPALSKTESVVEITGRAVDLHRSALLKFWDPAAHPRAGAPPNPGWFAPASGAESASGAQTDDSGAEAAAVIPVSMLGDPWDWKSDLVEGGGGGGPGGIIGGGGIAPRSSQPRSVTEPELPLPEGSPTTRPPTESPAPRPNESSQPRPDESSRSPSDTSRPPSSTESSGENVGRGRAEGGERSLEGETDPQSEGKPQGNAEGGPMVSGQPYQLAPYKPGGPTSGVLEFNGESLGLKSGYDGPADAMPPKSPGFDGRTLSHVEGHAAAYMREHGIMDATLRINNPTICKSCTKNLWRMLPRGATLRIILPNGRVVPFVGGKP